MGNCQGYFYTKETAREDKEFKTQKERIAEALKIVNKSKSNTKPETNELSENESDQLIKIQKVFRGFIYRKKEKFNYAKTKSKIDALDYYLLQKSDPRMKIHDDQRKYYETVKIDNNRNYVGEWKNGMKDGLGTLLWADGSTYIGFFNKDKVNGFGKLIHTDGDVYVGHWKDDRASGVGKYFTTKGASYCGFWDKDKQNGFGEEVWPKGSNFNGEYKDGTKCGIGVFFFENGSIYEGEFYNNDINGIGTYYFNDRKNYQGNWKNNKMNGYGIITWPDGRTFEGFFVDDKREGFGIYYNLNKIYIGYWKNSKIEGNGILIDNATVKKAIWKDNKMIEKLPDNFKLPFDYLIDDIIKENYT